MNKSLTISQSIKRHKHFDDWLRFHMQNRTIIREIIAEMDKLIASGKKQISVKHILIVIRHKESVSISGDYPYKINDAFTSIYAHVIADTFPQKYRKYIEKRKLKAVKHY